MNGIIYLVKNKFNGKSYVGQTQQKWPLRKEQHIKNKSKYSLINNAIKKYGSNSFEWVILEDNIKTQRNLNLLEKFHIIQQKSHVDCGGYNLQTGGFNGKPSNETRKKLSLARVGKGMGKDNPMYGKPLSRGHKLKVSNALKGQKRSIDFSKNMSISRRKNKYPGTYFTKKDNPEKKCWVSRINYKGHKTLLGIYQDPLSASLVYQLVWDEIYG